MTLRQVTSTLVSALCNALPFISTWGGFLMSTVAWMRLQYCPNTPCTSCNPVWYAL